MDRLAPELAEPVFAQIGKSTHVPKNMSFSAEVAPKLFEEKFATARVVVAHAGIGTILTARKLGKPIVLVPRRAGLGEHRNDHQLATCAQLASRPGIFIAENEGDLRDALDQAIGSADTSVSLLGSPSLEDLKLRLDEYVKAL